MRLGNCLNQAEWEDVNCVLTFSIILSMNCWRGVKNALNESGSNANYIEIKGTVHGFINYPKAVGAEETDCMIRQFTSGRPVNKIQPITEAELKRQGKLKMQEASQKFKAKANKQEEKEE